LLVATLFFALKNGSFLIQNMRAFYFQIKCMNSNISDYIQNFHYTEKYLKRVLSVDTFFKDVA